MSFAFERQAVINSCQPNLSEITISNALFVLIAPTLASAWEASPPGSVLGELVFRKGGGKGPNLKKIKPSLEVKVAATIANANKTGAQLPLHYSLQAMTKKLPSLHPLAGMKMVPSKYTEKFLGLLIYRWSKTQNIELCARIVFLTRQFTRNVM